MSLILGPVISGEISPFASWSVVNTFPKTIEFEHFVPSKIHPTKQSFSQNGELGFPAKHLLDDAQYPKFYKENTTI